MIYYNTKIHILNYYLTLFSTNEKLISVIILKIESNTF